MVGVEESYRRCQQATRRTSSSFYYSFFMLPREKRRAMYALYAFLRHTDDLSDGSEPTEVKRILLAEWRDALHAALRGEYRHAILPAVADTLARFAVPSELLTLALDGVEMDLDPRRYMTFADLEEYCFRVAGVVGQACIHIWGFSDRAALEPARLCGTAFQLTNILRDLSEDAERGRIYVPLEDLERFGYSPSELMHGVRDERFAALMQFEIARTDQLYGQAEVLAQYLEPEGVQALGAMTSTYRGLLTEIKRRDGDVFSERVQLSTWRKLRIATRWWFTNPARPPTSTAVSALSQ